MLTHAAKSAPMHVPIQIQRACMHNGISPPCIRSKCALRNLLDLDVFIVRFRQSLPCVFTGHHKRNHISAQHTLASAMTSEHDIQIDDSFCNVLAKAAIQHR